MLWCWMKSLWIACYKAYFKVPHEFQWILCSDKEQQKVYCRKKWIATTINLNSDDVPQVIL